MWYVFLTTTLLLNLLTQAQPLNGYVSNCIHEAYAPPLSYTCDPSTPQMNNKAPATFTTQIVITSHYHPHFTSSRSFLIHVRRSDAPHAADRFYNMVVNDALLEQRFYRVVSGWVAQFGINGQPLISSIYNSQHTVPGSIIASDPVLLSNLRGTLAYSQSLCDEKACNATGELFINFADNSQALDHLGFAPFGRIAEEEMNSVETEIYSEYGELPSICKDKETANPHAADSRCLGPNYDRIYTEGNQYLKQSFAKMTYISAASIYDPNQKNDANETGDTTGDKDTNFGLIFGTTFGVLFIFLLTVFVIVSPVKVKKMCGCCLTVDTGNDATLQDTSTTFNALQDQEEYTTDIKDER